MAVYVDADACPVREEAERVATRHGLKTYIVSNGGLRLSRNPLVETVIVDQGADVADMWIAEKCGPGDVVVTSDVPLAARCVESGARVLRHNGEVFTSANIGAQLAMRDLMSDIRSANPLSQGGGGKPFSKADKSRFLNALEREIRSAQKARS